MISWSRLREPDITTVSTKLTGFKCLSNIYISAQIMRILITFTHANGTTSSIDEPRTLLHLGDECFVEHAFCLLVKRTIDGDNISLTEHFLKRFNATSTNFFLGFGTEGLIVEVKKFLAIEGYEASQDTFTDAADTDSGNNFSFDVERIFGNCGDIPITPCNLFVRRDKVANESEHGKNDYSSEPSN